MKPALSRLRDVCVLADSLMACAETALAEDPTDPREARDMIQSARAVITAGLASSRPRFEPTDQPLALAPT